MQYIDDTEMSVLPKSGVIFTQSNGFPQHFTNTYKLPEIVRIRLEQMPLVLKYLMMQSNNALAKSNFPMDQPIEETPLTSRRQGMRHLR